MVRFTGFRQNISQLHQLNEVLRERNGKMELAFKSVGMSNWDFDVATGQFRSFNDPVNDFNPERSIAPDDYLKAAYPDDTARVWENIENMLRVEDHEFTLPYHSRTKWDKEWKALIVTRLPFEQDRTG